MRRNTVRVVQLLATLALFAAATGTVAGCGEDGGGRGAEGGESASVRQWEARARQVAEAWDGSEAAEKWNRGYHPMGDAVQPPENGFRSRADEQAYATGSLVLRGGLPAAVDPDGQVRWDRGGSLTLPVTGARTAYEALGGGGTAGRPYLTVTAARLGEMAMATSRGPATVPAWLFTLEGYDTPLKRAAVRPSKLPEPPIGSARAVSTAELAPLNRLVEVAEDGRSVTVVADHGACDDGPGVDVLETGGSVVLSAYVKGTSDGVCTAQSEGRKVTVRLDRPVGERVLLDAYRGRPVAYGTPPGPSPSWS